MPRRVRRQGRLIQKPKNEPANDLKADRYYIVGVKTNSTAAWREGEFRTLKKAKNFILQEHASDLDISYYVVYGDQSRVLFAREGSE